MTRFIPQAVPIRHSLFFTFTRQCLSTYLQKAKSITRQTFILQALQKMYKKLYAPLDKRNSVRYNVHVRREQYVEHQCF